MKRDWKDLSYLRAGNCRQRRAYAVLRELQIAAVLRGFDPVLAGTVPLAIDIAGSDLDIICEVQPAAQAAFEQVLFEQYGHLAGFRLTRSVIGGHDSTLCRFRCRGEALEVFGQALPTEQQRAFRHMAVEHAVLAAGGEPWRIAARQLKEQGLKTEPAFAQLLRLPGDPYEALLALETVSPAELAALVSRCALPSG